MTLVYLMEVSGHAGWTCPAGRAAQGVHQFLQVTDIRVAGIVCAIDITHIDDGIGVAASRVDLGPSLSPGEIITIAPSQAIMPASYSAST